MLARPRAGSFSTNCGVTQSWLWATERLGVTADHFESDFNEAMQDTWLKIIVSRQNSKTTARQVLKLRQKSNCLYSPSSKLTRARGPTAPCLNTNYSPEQPQSCTLIPSLCSAGRRV